MNAFAALTSAGGRMKYTELHGVRHNAWIQAFTYQGDDKSKGLFVRWTFSLAAVSMG